MKLDAVAERLGKSKRTVMRMVDQRRFVQPTIRKGRVIEFSDGAVERWFCRRRNLRGEK